MTERPIIDVAGPPGGWGAPWPNVAEIESVLPHANWTLVGGLMAQLHCIHKGFDPVRITNDVDIVLHVETTRGVAAAAASALEALGYELTLPTDPRIGTAHRFRRGMATVDLLSSPPDLVDVLVADHAAPRVAEKLRGRTMVAIEGGTQALRRTVNARLDIMPGTTTTVSVPAPLGALVLKAAAYQTDSRDRARHLQDAATLLCCVDDPYAEREQYTGSDRVKNFDLRCPGAPSRLLTRRRSQFIRGSRLGDCVTKQRPTLKKWHVAALGGVIVLLAIIITVGTISERANEQAAPTATPTEAPVASETATPELVATETPESGQVLTVDNNEDFAALLAGPEHGDAVEAFATKYQGRTIEFDGNIAAVNNFGDDDTRYYFLILAGNYGEPPMTGPNFQFRDVSVLDLHLTGSNIPASVGVGDNLHIIAEVDGYNDVQGLFFLDPVSTEIR